MYVHSTSVFWHDKGILITGKSGSGKSDLALRLIYEGAILISDDQTLLHDKITHIEMSSPTNIQGLLEVRGIGIIKVPYSSNIKLDYHINITNKPIERMPTKQTYTILNKSVPSIEIYKAESNKLQKIWCFISYSIL
jgi:serine kinase of HPr protein (carbohydrate metabolism regulator)